MSHNTVISLYTETSGSNFVFNGIIQITSVIGTIVYDKIKIIDKFHICMKLDRDQVFEELLMKKYWSKNTELLDFIKKNSVSKSAGYRKFVKYLNKYFRIFPKMKYLCYNSQFDLGRISYELCKYGYNPLSFSNDGKNTHLDMGTDLTSFTGGAKLTLSRQKEVLQKILGFRQQHIKDSLYNNAPNIVFQYFIIDENL